MLTAGSCQSTAMLELVMGRFPSRMQSHSNDGRAADVNFCLPLDTEPPYGNWYASRVVLCACSLVAM